jgi:tetratricopeptide (TPR) repeat protein
MDSTANSPASKGPWTSDKAPCVYCGQVIGRTDERCPHCKVSFSLAVRRASREGTGDWFYLDPRNPSARGVTFETLIKMIEKGRIRTDSIVRGPTTQQDWQYAAEAPRLAKYLGLCPHCFAEAKPEDAYCTRCQLNMNTRLGEPRPGIPADLIREPFHRPSHEMEKQLSQSAPTPQVAAVAAAASAASSGGPSEGPEPPKVVTAAAAAAAAAMADASPSATDRVSRVGIARRRRPRLWLVLVLTWVTLLPIALIIWYANIGGIRDHLKGSFGGRGPETPPGATQVGDEWLNQQLAKASAAAQAKNYTRAVEIYDAIIAKTRDEATWQPRKQALLQQKALEERKERRDKLKERLEMAQGLASEQKFDDAMAVLRNIGQEDRTWLKAAGVGVEIMENAIREDQAKAVRAKQLDEKLVTELAQADALRTGGKLADALKVYTQIASTYPADLVRKRINLEQMLQELQARLAVVAPTPGGTAPTPGSATVPPDQVATVVADMLKEAAALEKAEKFAAALAKLEEIKQRFEQKSWPEGLEKRIRDVKAKKEALEFFGVEGPKKAPKTP